MTSDPAGLADTARALNRRSLDHVEQADICRLQRDGFIRALRETHGWSYGRIATEVGVSKGLVAVICRPARL